MRPSHSPFKPLFFSEAEFTAVRRLTELLLGETSENDAVAEEVAEWIDLRVSSADSVRHAAAGFDPLHHDLQWLSMDLLGCNSWKIGTQQTPAEKDWPG